ncbi:magnesium transporter MgtE [Ligilactobacillus pabuli]|uniref:Magnesium transporter MgtE n=1 Tax=Ligilactobacillus pabuli TaxID=2886039 RepID=A0ABQ5JJW9_9LACO|nr:magnesium transporter [Ligilactobacillus pabuli]GKS82362.1 magnesium transporter MgtE [Ligilactobacillus pabuli]
MADKQMQNLNKNERIVQLLSDQKAKLFRREYLDLHIHEQAQLFSDLDGTLRSRVYRYLSAEEVGDMFDGIEEEPEDVVRYFKEMPVSYAAAVIDEMYTDNAVDILAYAQNKDLTHYLLALPAERSAEIRELLHYEDKTAGALMTTEYVDIYADQDISSAIQDIRSEAADAELIYYAYVVSSDNELIGVVTLRDLLTNAENTAIADIMTNPVISVPVDEDQAEVAQKVRDYNFVAVPVVDYANKLVGIINVDDIIDVIDEENAGEYSGLAGVDTEETPENPFQASLKRLPWLLILLLMGMSTTSLIDRYEALISQASILAVFVSLITGTAGNAGTQSLAVAIRGLSNSEEDRRSGLRMLVNELLTGLIAGVVTGSAIFLLVGIWKSNFVLGFVIGISMATAITVATIAGNVIPLVMDKIGVDPAVASGPFISTLSDLTSVLIYFNIAHQFLNFFVNH